MYRLISKVHKNVALAVILALRTGGAQQIKGRILSLLVGFMFTLIPIMALASQSCPTGAFDIYSHNDRSRNFAGRNDLVIAVDEAGNCSGALGWGIVGTTAFTELRFDQFSYLGDGWFDLWNSAEPQVKYTAVIDLDGNAQIFWGVAFTGHARRISAQPRRIRITNNEARPVTDVAIALEWEGVLWDWDIVSDITGEFTGTTYFGQTGFASELYGNTNFLYFKGKELSGEQIIINKIDPRTYTGNVFVRIWFKINGQEHFDLELLQNWSDSTSPEYVDFILDTAGTNSSWDEGSQQWVGNFLRPAPLTTPCAAPGFRQVTIYQDSQLRGACKILGIGEYPNSDAFRPVGNDSISSLEVGSGVSVTLYQNANYGGLQTTLQGGNRYLTLGNFNDRTSSMKVVSNAPPAQP